MPANDFELVQGDVRLRVEGLAKTVRKMEKAGADSQDMRDLMHRTGMIVVSASRLPVDSGQLGGTVRAGRGKTKAVVRAGGARAPYAGVINYGWPARGIEAAAVPLQDTVQSERVEILDTLDAGIQEILDKNGLS